MSSSPPLYFLVFYGSYREARAGIRLADYIVQSLSAQGHVVELIDAKAVDLPMLDRRYFEYEPGTAPRAMAEPSTRSPRPTAMCSWRANIIRGMQPGLKNLVDHFFKEFVRRPAGIVSYSAGRLAGARSNSAWHATLTELGMAVIPNTITVGTISTALDESAQPIGEGGAALDRSFLGFAEELVWWAEAVKAKRNGDGRH